MKSVEDLSDVLREARLTLGGDCEKAGDYSSQDGVSCDGKAIARRLRESGSIQLPTGYQMVENADESGLDTHPMWMDEEGAGKLTDSSDGEQTPSWVICCVGLSWRRGRCILCQVMALR